MKKFVAADIVELNINETASGLWDSDRETNVCGGGWNPAYIFTEHPSKAQDEKNDTQDPETNHS